MATDIDKMVFWVYNMGNKLRKMNRIIKATLLGCTKIIRSISLFLMVLGIVVFSFSLCFVVQQSWIHLQGFHLVMPDSMRLNLLHLLIKAATPVAICGLFVLGADSALKKLRIA